MSCKEYSNPCTLEKTFRVLLSWLWPLPPGPDGWGWSQRVPLHAGGVLPHGERQGAMLGRHAAPVGLHLWPRTSQHQPIRMQGDDYTQRAGYGFHRTSLSIVNIICCFEDLADWATHESHQEPRENRWGHVWKVPVSWDLCGDSGCAHTLRPGYVYIKFPLFKAAL